MSLLHSNMALINSGRYSVLEGRPNTTLPCLSRPTRKKVNLDFHHKMRYNFSLVF